MSSAGTIETVTDAHFVSVIDSHTRVRVNRLQEVPMIAAQITLALMGARVSRSSPSDFWMIAENGDAARLHTL